MSTSLSSQRDRVQRQVETLEQCLCATNAELELLTTDTDDESDSEDTDEDSVQNTAGLLAQREKIQKEIQSLEEVLGPHSPFSVSSASDGGSSGEESDLDLPLSVDSCLQINLVYQQVLQETLDQLETLLTDNQKQQRELMYQLSGPNKQPAREHPANSSYQQPIKMYLGRFLKPYFKDKLTGLGPPANLEAKERASRMVNCLDDRKLKIKRWESWQKTLLIHSVTRDSLRRLIQPKLSKVDYLSQKLSSAEETDRQQLAQQIDSLEKAIDLIRLKKAEELISGRHEEHDWDRIANVDFEGTKEAEDIRCFWQNYLHPSINKSRWSREEVQQLKEVSSRLGHRRWEDIAAELGTGRTAFMCLQTFQRFVSDSLRRSSWTPDEDALLRELVDKMRIGNFIPYTQMSYFMEGRDPGQLIYRWLQVLDPSLRKGPWSKQEDELLLRAVARHGEKNWWKIRLEVPGRSPCACRDRYVNSLKAGMKRGAFDHQERALLLELIRKHGVGCWAKIAAEIPNRCDAQCLRDWKKVKKEEEESLNPERPQQKPGRRKVSSLVQRRKRCRLKTVKEEESSEEDEEAMVEYMDSDDEMVKESKDVVKEEQAQEDVEEVEEEEEEDNFILSSIEEWVPSEKTSPFPILKFQPAWLESSGHDQNKKHVRSTFLGPFGRSVIVGPKPREVRLEERHCGRSLLMVTPEQLRTQLYFQAQKCKNRRPSQNSSHSAACDRKHSPSQPTDTALGYQLQAAVTPWIGHLLIPVKPKRGLAYNLQEHTQAIHLSSTQVFLLLLQTMNIDTAGCKDMIEQRKPNMVGPPPVPLTIKKKNPKTVAGMLQQRALRKEKGQFDSQNTLTPNQPPLPPSQNHPDVLLQMPSGKTSLGSPLFYTPPVFQPLQSQLTSFKFIPPALPVSPQATYSSTPALVPISCLMLSVPNVTHFSMGQMSSLPQNSTSTCILNLCPVVVPSAQNLQIAIAHSTNRPGAPVTSNQHPGTQPFTSTLPPPPQPKTQTKDSSNKSTKAQEAAYRKQNEVNNNRTNAQVGGPSDLVSGPSDLVGDTNVAVSKSGAGLILDGKRSRKPSAKARALQEAAKVKATKKKHIYAKKPDTPPHPQPHCSSGPMPAPLTCEAESVPPAELRSTVDTLSRTGEDGGDLTGAARQESPVSVTQKGRKVLKPSWKTRALREATETRAEHQNKKIHSYFPPKKQTRLQADHCKKKGMTPDKRISHPPSGWGLTGQATPILTPGLTEAPSLRLQLAVLPALASDLPAKGPPSSHSTHAQCVPHFIQPHPLPTLPICQVKSPPAAFFLPSVSTGTSPCSGLSGHASLPPESTCHISLTSVSALLRAKKCLTRSSQLLCETTKTPETTYQPNPEQPDSTSSLGHAGTPGSCVSVDPQKEQEETELVAAIRQLVADGFGGNPAYQMLKARFLSCFTLPALLAAVQPITEEPKVCSGEEEEEPKEEEEEAMNIKQSGRQTRAQSITGYVPSLDWYHFTAELGCHDVDEVSVQGHRPESDFIPSELSALPGAAVDRCWAKIAAEIPNRCDAQCLRDWKKVKKEEEESLESCTLEVGQKHGGRGRGLSSSYALVSEHPLDQDFTCMFIHTAGSSAPKLTDSDRERPQQKPGRRKVSSLVQRRKRCRLKTVKEEESSEEDEEAMVEYMDSDDEMVKESKDVVKEEQAQEDVEEVEEEEEEDNFILSSIEEWVPSEKTSPFPILKFQPAWLESSGPFGRSVIVGPKPREVRLEERHCGRSLLMVTPEQLRTQLYFQAQKCKNRRPSQNSSHSAACDRKHSPSQPTDTALATSSRQRIDTVDWSPADPSCKDMIEQRKPNMVGPPPSSLNHQKEESKNCCRDAAAEGLEKRKRTPKTQTKDSSNKSTKAQEAAYRKQNEVNNNRTNAQVGGPSDLVSGPSDLVGDTNVAVSKSGAGLILDGKRSRKPSAKARALQEAAKVKATKKKHIYAKKPDTPPHPQPHCSSGPMPAPLTCEAESVPPAELRSTVDTLSRTGEDGGDLTGAARQESPVSVTQKGRKVLKPSWKTRALREATETRAEHQNKKIHSYFPPKKQTRLQADHCKKKGMTPDKRISHPPSGWGLTGQATPILTPGLTEAPSLRLQLAVLPALASDLPAKGPPSSHSTHAQCVPHFIQPHPLPTLPICQVKSPPAAFFLPSVSTGTSPCSGLSGHAQPAPRVNMPHKVVTRSDMPAPPLPRREVLQFDPSLMFLETKEEVHEWFSGCGGVVVPGLNVALPYLPPFVCSLTSVSALLRAKKCLTRSSQQLLCETTKTPETTYQPNPEQPDSTSSLGHAGTPGSCVSVDPQKEQEETELVAAIRQLVADGFGGNPAYQMLKARFLSCFTLPALLAAVQPITEEPKVCSGEEEEEPKEEEEEAMNIKQSGRQTRAQNSLLLHNGSGAPADHYTGITGSKPAASTHTQPNC
ncbi:snRNA-activating protein complex subunit 4 [Thalassophryne amazonica]|uniref:snRNA-activating protein complex subunit 4 n=1 Tax=Thalassophryne amazonica TaxID=390379 RepID=UPI001471BFFF|nr:snRNA-activating protein complex subunit 4 [Thalassophryne amazonica]